MSDRARSFVFEFHISVSLEYTAYQDLVVGKLIALTAALLIFAPRATPSYRAHLSHLSHYYILVIQCAPHFTPFEFDTSGGREVRPFSTTRNNCSKTELYSTSSTTTCSLLAE